MDGGNGDVDGVGDGLSREGKGGCQSTRQIRDCFICIKNRDTLKSGRALTRCFDIACARFGEH